MSKVNVQLTHQDALSFVEWRKNQEVFESLLQYGVFGVRNGHAEIHFDNEGSLASVTLHFKVYQRGKLDKKEVFRATLVT